MHAQSFCLRTFLLCRTSEASRRPRSYTAPDEKDCPSIANLMRVDDRKKWFAYKAAFDECGGDVAHAEERYIVQCEKLNGVTIER